MWFTQYSCDSTIVFLFAKYSEVLKRKKTEEKELREREEKKVIFGW